MDTVKLKKLFIYFLFACTASALIASDPQVHPPRLLNLETPLNNIDEIISSYKLKYFKLTRGNKLYTNAPDGINLISVINKIIWMQDSLFKLKSKPYKIILIDTPKASTTEGVAKGRYIIVEGNLKQHLKEYVRVISHELIHRYIGHILKPPKKNEAAYKWFFEGFTEFFGVQTLLDIQLINEDEYLKLVNASLEEWGNRLAINIGLERSGRTSQLTSYNKGFILALIIDKKLRQISHRELSLRIIIDTIIREVSTKATHFDIDLFIDCLERHLPKPFVQKILVAIRDSSQLMSLLPHKLLNKNLGLQFVDRHDKLCFNVKESIESRKIQGVQPKSDCYTKGLRNHQELKCYSIYFNSGKVKVKVLDENKKEKTIYLKANKTLSSTPMYR